MIDSLRAQLCRDEGCQLRPYRDTQDNLTIGWGRNLDAVGVSLAEAEMMLDNDILRANAAVLAEYPWTLQMDEVRRGVLVNLVFNMGTRRLATFALMLQAMQAGDWPEAAQQLLDSRYAKQVPLRAGRLARQLVEGTWQ